jgi:hypothetical protein
MSGIFQPQTKAAAVWLGWRRRKRCGTIFSLVCQNDTERNAIDTMDNLWNMGGSRWLRGIPVWFRAGFRKKRTVFCFP